MRRWRDGPVQTSGREITMARESGPAVGTVGLGGLLQPGGQRAADGGPALAAPATGLSG